jgi:cell division protein FtsZ
MDADLITLPLEGLTEDSIIKVIGVGGGGCNAVNYMHRQGLKDVSFLVCNTDRQVLLKSSVPSKLQLGPGLGAGGDPETARQYAEESKEHIREALNDGTQMLFLAAGMGGGTGTGASSVVAEVAQEMGILTVGIVTIPFAFEGKKKIVKAMTGVARLAKHVDALLIINNEKLKQIYPDLNLLNAFSKSDDVVCNAARAIAEIITVPGYINTDFADVRNTLRKGGVAIMNVGRASGENRITNAINDALNSPLVNTNDVHGAERILLQFYCSTEHAIVMQEIDQINEFVQEVGDDIEVQWGASLDESLGEDVRVTIIATGYKVDGLPTEEAEEGKKTIDEAIEENYPPQSPNPMEDEPVQTIDLSGTLFPLEDKPVEPRVRPASASADDILITIDEDEPAAPKQAEKKEPEKEESRSPFAWIRRK